MQVKRARVGRAARWTVVAALGAVMAPPLVPPAAAQEITIKVTPTHGSDGEYFAAEGVGNCEDLRMIIEYYTYAGGYTSHGTDFRGKFDQKIQGVPYKIQVRVPHTTRPGSADIFVAPYCGPDDWFPTSKGVKVTIDRARVRFTVTPARPRVGQAVTIVGTGCYGTTSATATVPVEVRWANGTLARRVALTRPGNAAIGDGHSFTVRTTAPPGAEGTATVALLAGADCPGSVVPAQVAFPVRPRYVAPPPTTSPPTTPPAPPPSATASTTPPATATTPTTAAPAGSDPTPTVGPANRAAQHRRVPAALALPAAALVAAAAFGATRLRRTP